MRPASTPSAGLLHLPAKARELTTRYVRAWIEARHAEVQFFTAGYLVTVDYVAQPGPDGAVWCYPTLQAAEAAAVRAMRSDKTIMALPCPVERYKRALDEQLRWIEMVLGDALA